MISINEKACVRCLKCVYVCPFNVMTAREGNVPALDTDKRCLECLHCAAACPADAILADGKPAAGGPPADLPAAFPEDLAGFLKARRSYRHFQSRPVEEDLLLAALSLADFAPSAKNQHPAGWIAVNRKEQVEEIMAHILAYVEETGTSPEIVSEYAEGNNVVTGTAPTLLLAYADPKAINAPVDCALSLHTAELYLQSRGVGTCWAGYLTRMANAVPALRELFALPEGRQFYGALMAGYPEEETYRKLPVRRKEAPIRFL